MPRHALPLAFVVLVPGVIAQNAAPPVEKSAEKPAAKAPFVFEPGVVDVRTLIQRCGAYLQRNILVDEVELSPGGNQRLQGPQARGQGPQGAPADAGKAGPTVELTLPVVTDRDGCEDLLCSLLWTRGLALVPLDEGKGVYEVLSMHGARGREISMRALHRTPEQVLARPALRQFVTVVCTLKHVNATIATNALRPFYAGVVSQNSVAGALMLGNVGNETALVLSGMQDAVANALIVLQTADVPQPGDPKPELKTRFETLARQHEHLLQRIAALEEKLKGK